MKNILPKIDFYTVARPWDDPFWSNIGAPSRCDFNVLIIDRIMNNTEAMVRNTYEMGVIVKSLREML